MDIIAKEMTRGEFLSSEYIVIKNSKGNVISYKCPYEYGLDGYYTNCMTSCIECWENAIKDIKFKGENDMLKEQCVEMTFDNDEEWQEVKKQYEKLGYEIVDWSINYMKKEFYLKAILTDSNTFKDTKKQENKIDYDREYNILEIKEFPEETEFISEGKYISKLKDGFLKARYADDISNSWTKCFLTKEWLNAKFKLVKKDKKIDFIEAIQAYGKHIYCIWKDDNGIEHKSEYCIRNEWDQCITDQNCEYLTPAEILNGEWYIMED